MLALLAGPAASEVPPVVFSPLFLIGSLIGFVGWIMLVIYGFKEKVWWGLLILLGPIATGLVFGMSPWPNLIADLAITLPFVLPRLGNGRIGAGFVLLMLGEIMSIPGSSAMTRWGQEQSKARIAAEPNPAPPPTTQTVQQYVTPAIQPEPMTPPPKKRTVATTTQQPEIVMPEIVQVYVLNSTKKYYPLDCGTPPEGAYKMAKSMAVRQGYKLAPECGK